MRNAVNDRISISQTSTDRGPARANCAGARPARRRRSTRPYRRLPLLELIRRVVEHRDRRALLEFHDFRTVFRHRDGHPLRFVEYIQRLRENEQERAWAHDDPSVLDAAYDMTLDKFTHLPPGRASNRSKQNGRRKSRRPRKSAGPDCRLYFRPFLRCADRQLDAPPACSELEREDAAARLLQRLVHKHFRFSCLEAKRRSVCVMRRYTWQAERGVVRVWMPVEFTGQQCRQWLERHAAEVDLTSPHAEKLVRAIAREGLGYREVLHFSDLGVDHPPAQTCAKSPPPRTGDLAGFVAEEKAEQIALQRPAISALGPRKLARLIRRIFEDLETGVFKDSQVARDFGLNKATFSRFAGSQWSHASDDHRTAGTPDLWHNTAQVIAAHPDFVDAAKYAGVWQQVAEVVRYAGRARVTGDV